MIKRFGITTPCSQILWRILIGAGKPQGRFDMLGSLGRKGWLLRSLELAGVKSFCSLSGVFQLPETGCTPAVQPIGWPNGRLGNSFNPPPEGHPDPQGDGQPTCCSAAFGHMKMGELQTFDFVRGLAIYLAPPTSGKDPQGVRGYWDKWSKSSLCR